MEIGKIGTIFCTLQTQFWSLPLAALQNVEKGEYLYEGGVATVEFVKQYIIDEGPFDGIWAFSQVKSFSYP